MNIRHDTFIVERFPEYRRLLARDIRRHRITRAIRWTLYSAAFALGAYAAAMIEVPAW